LNKSEITLGNRKSLLRWIAGFALAGLLAGAGPLGATPAAKVRCVPWATVHAGCTIATTYATIQAAVNAAQTFDVIYVGPGVYHESVTISEAGHSRDNLSLLGAQAGNDARVGRTNPLKESVIDATGKGNSALIVEAEAVVIDGFTVQGATQGSANGIDLKGSNTPDVTPANGAIVINNIVVNNNSGVALNTDGYGTPNTAGSFLIGAIVEHNYIKTNNAGSLAAGPGCGIWADGVQEAVITQNSFFENKASALCVEYAQNTTIANNTSLDDASFAQFTATSNVVFSNNQGQNFAAQGTIGGITGSGDAAVGVGPGNQYLVISDNTLQEGSAPVVNGIAFTTVWGATAINSYVYVKNNTISSFPQDGIVAESATDPTAGTLTESMIFGNTVENNGQDGIYLDGADVNGSNQLFDNTAEGNTRFDCHDDTSGGGTAGTANLWFHNTGILSQPQGLCTRVP